MCVYFEFEFLRGFEFAGGSLFLCHESREVYSQLLCHFYVLGSVKDPVSRGEFAILLKGKMLFRQESVLSPLSIVSIRHGF
jgi:hypothetical protein